MRQTGEAYFAFLPDLRVVTLLRGDRNPRSQQFLERPEMIGQPQSHGRRALLIAMRSIPKRKPQSPMEVVIEERPRPRAHPTWHSVWRMRAFCG